MAKLVGTSKVSRLRLDRVTGEQVVCQEPPQWLGTPKHKITKAKRIDRLLLILSLAYILLWASG